MLVPSGRDLDAVLPTLTSDNDRRFLARVFATPPSVYAARLAAIGFVGLEHVLDAGCGFGQWSQALQAVNARVSACDIAPERIAAARALASHGAAPAAASAPITFQVASLEALPYPDAHFDAVFCYGALFVCDLRRALDECTRVLRPGGRLYVTANDIGWLVHRLEGRTPGAADLVPEVAAWDAMANSLRYFAGLGATPGQQLVVPREIMHDELLGRGYLNLQSGAEGSVTVPGAPAGTPFFPGEVRGYTACYEVLATRGATRRDDAVSSPTTLADA